MSRIYPLLVIVGLVSVLACSSVSKTHGIPNLAQVEPGVWRGGQPNTQGWAWLASQGVTNVIKLNTEGEGSDAGAEALGMTVMRLPITFSQQIGLTTIPPDIFDAALATVAPGIFCHCERGQDRSGLFVGLYRVKREGWTRKEAQKEMELHGYHAELVGLSRFWRESTAPK